MSHTTGVYIGKTLAQYHFGEQHPFGPLRHDAFVAAFYQQALEQQTTLLKPVQGSDAQVLRFHTPAYLSRVKQLSRLGQGYLDQCDTPAFPGIYEAALSVVGTTLDGLRRIMLGQFRHVFSPIAGLHHARRDSAAGFCVFNDCGIAIETLRAEYQLRRVAYVDIDAHHGDGVFYSFADDPDLCIVDIHEDGRHLYPGTGAAHETGIGVARGSKLNIPMPMAATDEEFFNAWRDAEQFIDRAEPEFILFQCGADSLAGDPITHLRYSQAAHEHATRRLCMLAEKYAQGRILVMGGGGYNVANLAAAWSAVVSVLAAYPSMDGE